MEEHKGSDYPLCSSISWTLTEGNYFLLIINSLVEELVTEVSLIFPSAWRQKLSHYRSHLIYNSSVCVQMFEGLEEVEVFYDLPALLRVICFRCDGWMDHLLFKTRRIIFLHIDSEFKCSLRPSNVVTDKWTFTIKSDCSLEDRENDLPFVSRMNEGSSTAGYKRWGCDDVLGMSAATSRTLDVCKTFSGSYFQS